MEPRRTRVVRVPLTAEQQAAILQASGREVHEVIFAAPVSHRGSLDSEVAELADSELANQLWGGTSCFLETIAKSPDVKTAFERYAGHELDDRDPLIVLVR